MGSRRGFIKWSVDAGTWLRTSDADADPERRSERDRLRAPGVEQYPDAHERDDSMDRADAPRWGPTPLPDERQKAPSPPDAHEGD